MLLVVLWSSIVMTRTELVHQTVALCACMLPSYAHWVYGVNEEDFRQRFESLGGDCSKNKLLNNVAYCNKCRFISLDRHFSSPETFSWTHPFSSPEHVPGSKPNSTTKKSQAQVLWKINFGQEPDTIRNVSIETYPFVLRSKATPVPSLIKSWLDFCSLPALN